MIEAFLQVIAQFAGGILLRFRGSKPTSKLDVVSDFDFDRFQGTWYLAAYIPPPFQKKLSSATTQYLRGDNGEIKVINRAYDEKKEKWIVEETAGRFKDAETDGWLIVDTSKPLDENRKIIFLNDNYDQAILVGLTMRTLWITYRDPHLEKRELDRFIGRASDLGFKIRQLVRVDQTHDWRNYSGNTTPTSSA